MTCRQMLFLFVSFVPFVVVKEQSPNDPFPFQFRVISEVDEKTKSKSSRLQIVVNLCSMFVSEFGDRFDLQNDPVEADKVRLVYLSQFVALVTQLQFLLSGEWDGLETEFEFQAFLINGFHKTAALFIVYFEAGTDGFERLFFEQDFGHWKPRKGLPGRGQPRITRI